MSTLKQPVGPQSKAVYWRRRLLVALGLAAVIAVVILIVVKPGSAPAPKQPAGDVESQTSPSASPAGPKDGAPCEPSDIQVEAITDDNSYQAGETVHLSLSLTNTGSNSCVIDAGTAEQVYTITSGSELYWTSTDCQTDATHTQVELLPGKTVTTSPITWDRTRSDPGTCNADRPQVPAGGASYHLSTSVNGIESRTTKQFLLY